MPSRSHEIQPSDLGPMARRARELRGLTVREAAEELAVTNSALSQAERGARRMVQLALRSLNVHIERASETGIVAPGAVRNPLVAEDGAVDIFDQVRSPDAERRAALLRQSLLARGIELDVGGRFAVVELADARVRVDLGPMAIHVGRRTLAHGPTPLRRGGPSAHGLLLPDSATAGEGDAEGWSRPIDLFAQALAEAGAGASFDEGPLARVLKPLGPSWLSTQSE